MDNIKAGLAIAIVILTAIDQIAIIIKKA